MLSYTSRKKSEQNGFAEEFARDIERREGRQEVRVKIEVDTSTEERAADLIKSGALDHLLKGFYTFYCLLRFYKIFMSQQQTTQVESCQLELQNFLEKIWKCDFTEMIGISGVRETALLFLYPVSCHNRYMSNFTFFSSMITFILRKKPILCQTYVINKIQRYLRSVCLSYSPSTFYLYIHN